MASASLDLIGAVLGDRCHAQEDAAAVLATAHRLGVDPLDFCIHRCQLSPEQVYRRAARWADFAFSNVIPNTGGWPEIRRLDGLAEIRGLRLPLYDRQIIYVAPRFEEVLDLRERARAQPALRRETCITPPGAIRRAIAEMAAPHLLDAARQRLARRWPQASASFDLPLRARLVLLAVLAAIAAATVLFPAASGAVLVPTLGTLLAVPALAKLVATLDYREPRTRPPPLGEAELPVYSILIPLRDEAQMVPLLKRAMEAIDYPPEKLDIKFVVEARSTETIAAVEALLADPRFELVSVPDSAPATKPKALDYALPLVRGSHVVVYDAEDIPNADQLRLAAAAFAADPGIDCLQAELLVDNALENVLTGLFTGEYAGQFGIMLPAMARWGVPVPLGGTSNHFRVAALRETGGWDAYNVTEDADLGVRLARLRYRVGVLPSQTFEEAPIRLDGWLRQRRRWMKGWMQTFLVHNRDPRQLLRDLGWKNFLAFEFHVGAMIVSPILHTAFGLALLLRGIDGGAVMPSLADPVTQWSVLVLILGYGSSLVLTAKGLERIGHRRLMALQWLLPFYWTLHALATIHAAYELATRPHFWAKTTHGLTRLERNFGLTPRRQRQQREVERVKGIEPSS